MQLLLSRFRHGDCAPNIHFKNHTLPHKIQTILMENIIIDVCKVFGLEQDSANLDYIHQELTAF